MINIINKKKVLYKLKYTKLIKLKKLYKYLNFLYNKDIK